MATDANGGCQRGGPHVNTVQKVMAKMTNKKWLEFWSAIIIFLLMTTHYLFRKGVFNDADLVVLGIIGFLFCAVGVALYVYIKERTEDPGST